MTNEQFESSITRDVAIRSRCKTIRAVCWTTIVAGVAATTIVNAIFTFKGLCNAAKKSREAAVKISEYTSDDN